MEQFTINPEYPMNLVKVVFDIKEEDFNASDFPEPKQLVPSVEYVLHTLEEREMEILHYRYLYGLTKTEVARTKKLSLERIRQIEAKALRKLRHPSRVRFIRHGVEGVIKLEKDQMQEIIDRYQEEIANGENVNIENPWIRLLNIPIEELDLTVRAFNCLKRHSAYGSIDTVGKIIEAFKSNYILKVRNLGRKSTEEIRAKLIEIGIPPKELDYDEDVEREVNQRIKKKETDSVRFVNAALDQYRIVSKEQEKEAADKIKYVHDAILESTDKALAVMFDGHVLEALQAHIKQFLPNERVVGMLLKTELYDPRDGISPYKEFIESTGFLQAMRSFQRSTAQLVPGDVTWNRYLVRTVMEDLKDEGSNE